MESDFTNRQEEGHKRLHAPGSNNCWLQVSYFADLTALIPCHTELLTARCIFYIVSSLDIPLILAATLW